MNKSILIVDDEKVMREFLSEVLEDFEINRAADGDEAIQLLKDSEYDLVITDMKMPRVSGEEVVKYIKENCPKTKVIVISGYSSLSSVSSTIGYGIEAFLSKPFTIKQIRTEVERCLGSDRSKTVKFGL